MANAVAAPRARAAAERAGGTAPKSLGSALDRSNVRPAVTSEEDRVRREDPEVAAEEVRRPPDRAREDHLQRAAGDVRRDRTRPRSAGCARNPAPSACSGSERAAWTAVSSASTESAIVIAGEPNRCRRKRRTISITAVPPRRKSSSRSAEERASRTGTSASASVLTARARSSSRRDRQPHGAVGARLRRRSRRRRARRRPRRRGRPRRGSAARRGAGLSPRSVCSCVTRPPERKTTRSQTLSTSASWCELSTIVAPRAFASRIRSRTTATPSGSVPGGGLVEKEQLRILQHGLGDPDALEHPARVAGERRRQHPAVEAHPCRRRRDLAPGLPRVASGEPPVLGQERAARQVAVEAEPLRHVAGSRAHGEIVRCAGRRSGWTRSRGAGSRAGRRAASSCPRRSGRSAPGSRRRRTSSETPSRARVRRPSGRRSSRRFETVIISRT